MRCAAQSAEISEHDPPDLLRVGLEEDLVQPAAELVDDPVLQAARVRALGEPRTGEGEHAADGFHGTELGQGLHRPQGVIEELALIVDPGRPSRFRRSSGSSSVQRSSTALALEKNRAHRCRNGNPGAGGSWRPPTCTGRSRGPPRERRAWRGGRTPLRPAGPAPRTATRVFIPRSLESVPREMLVMRGTVVFMYHWVDAYLETACGCMASPRRALRRRWTAGAGRPHVPEPGCPGGPPAPGPSPHRTASCSPSTTPTRTWRPPGC